jgi:tryptophan halogenase
MNRAAATTPPTESGAEQLFRLVRGLRVNFGCERSFRLCRGALLPNRLLLSLSKRALEPGANEKLLALCRQLNMPPEGISATGESLDAARFIHLGFEESSSACLYKLYLEHGLPEGGPHGPVLLHLAFKWQPHCPSRFVVTHYTWHPFASTEDVLGRVTELLSQPGHEEACAIAQEVVRLAARRVGPDDLRYLEVTEESGRRSFDLNVYNAGLRLRDLAPLLARMCRHHGIDSERFEAVYEPIQFHSLGHVAGGVHREGQDFFTIYHGVESWEA